MGVSIDIYILMASAAILLLKDRSGSSLASIRKCISTYTEVSGMELIRAMREGTRQGVFILNKGSYKLAPPSKKKVAPKKKKAAPKKKAAAPKKKATSTQ